jgi:hypothetical protein
LYAFCSPRHRSNARNDPQPPFGPFDAPGTIGIGWWLRVRCRCERTTDFPVPLLIRRHGPRARAPELLARMRCGGCGARPVSADYIDHPAGGAKGSGYPPPRRVPVLPVGEWSAAARPCGALEHPGDAAPKPEGASRLPTGKTPLERK